MFKIIFAPLALALLTLPAFAGGSVPGEYYGFPRLMATALPVTGLFILGVAFWFGLILLLGRGIQRSAERLWSLAIALPSFCLALAASLGR